jgi:hypothetical protein
MEFEADTYGLNSARQPDGEANVDLMLGEYRKRDPGLVQEFIFFDHPRTHPQHRCHALEGGVPGVGIPGRAGQAPLQFHRLGQSVGSRAQDNQTRMRSH